MSRFSHTDPRYNAALDEMGRNLRALMDARDWSQADLMREASQHMPLDRATQKPRRMAADNISNFTNGKRCPTRVFVKALASALGVDEGQFMPALLRERTPADAPRPVLQEVPGKEGIYRVTIDRELPLAHALRIIAELEAHSDKQIVQ
jgi:transcriptional regulator with XRE-family HTH domain